MDREPEDVRHHRTIELGGTVTAGFYDRVDEQGRPHVAVLLEQRLIPGGEVGHEFLTDMTRLDAVRAAAYEYSQGGIREQGERTEQVLDCTITCFPFQDAKTVEDFAVEIEQTTSRPEVAEEVRQELQTAVELLLRRTSSGKASTSFWPNGTTSAGRHGSGSRCSRKAIGRLRGSRRCRPRPAPRS